jgi:hypothetical protein
MTNEKAKQATQVTPEGAVEIDEKQLDQAAGAGDVVPISTFSLNFGKVEFDNSKTAPADLTGGSGPHVTPEKKI